jgi:hypothetical protein
MLQPVNTLVAEFGRASASQNYPHQASSDEVLKTTMKVAEIFARMVGTDHKMAHSIANDLKSMSICRSCPWLPSYWIWQRKHGSLFFQKKGRLRKEILRWDASKNRRLSHQSGSRRNLRFVKTPRKCQNRRYQV